MSTEVDSAPNLSALYLKAVTSGPLRRGGELPQTEYVRRGIEIDQAHLAEYNRVCGFGLRWRRSLTSQTRPLPGM